MVAEAETKLTWEDFAKLYPNSHAELSLPAAAIGGVLALPDNRVQLPKPGRRSMIAATAAAVVALNLGINHTAHAADKVNQPSPEKARINQLLQRSQTVESPLGFRLIDEELEEYILVLDQNLATRLRAVDSPIAIVQIADPFLNEETGLRNEAYVMHDRRIGQAGQDFAVKWAVGDSENPHGLWMTDWFGEDRLKEINWLYAKWHSVTTENEKKAFMENVQFLNAESQRLPIGQRFSVPPRRLPGVMPNQTT